MDKFSINPCLRTDKKQKRNGTYPVYLRIRIEGKESKIPTGIEVSKEDWNDKKKSPKNSILQGQLQTKIQKIITYINRLELDEQKITLELVKDFCSGRKKENPAQMSFFDYYDKFLERKRNMGIKESSIDVYKNSRNVLRKFREGKEILISDISLSLIEDFDDYLCSDECKNMPSSRGSKHKNLRAVILDIKRHKIDVDNPYDGRFRIPQGKEKEIFLDIDELNAMRGLRGKFSHSSKQYKVLQMYLFSCYCGLRYSDIIDLKWKHVDLEKQEGYVKGIITKVQVKTQGSVCTPLYTYSRSILLELSKGKSLLKTDVNVFDNISSSTVNNILSKLTKIAGIKKHITFHSARHTFATLMIQEQQMGIFELSKCLGHKTLEMTKRYVKYDLAATINSAKEVDIFG